jgi:hypothetical protein
MIIVGLVLDTVTISYNVAGVLCEELGVACKHVFIAPFCCVCKGLSLCLIGCYTTGYKVDSRPCENLNALT